MSTSLVIVAIPAEDELIYKVSSEKVPHLTLMYLGEDVSDEAAMRMAEFVDHALNVNQHGPFYLDVDYRGELGEDKADVLFFNGGWEAKWIKSLRSQLLKQNDIRAAYEKSDQFPDWMPHLTLGYPATPAKELPADYSKIYGVQFDRIAVWNGDFEGPEFRLKWPEYEELDDVCGPTAAWSNLSEEGQAHVFKHHGTKGMKWGVRKEELAGGGHIRVSERTNMATVSVASVALYTAGAGVGAFISPRFRREWSAANAHNKQVKTDKKLAKKDMKWEKQIYTTDGAVKVHNAMADHFNQRIEAINNKPAYKDLNLNTHPDSPAAKKYLKEVNDLTMEGNRLAVQTVHGKSPSGKKEAQLSDDGQSIKILDADKVKHAAEEDEVIEFRLRWDDNGKVLEMNTAEATDDVQHVADRGVEFLSHHGVKGMHWGERKEDISRAASSSTSKFGKAVREADKFAKDVGFESDTRPQKDEDGTEMWSRAKVDIHNSADKEFRGKDLPEIKSKPEYVKAAKLKNRLLHPLDSSTKAYRKEVREAYIKRLETTANAMKNASGTREYTIRERGGDLPGSKYGWEVSTREARHAAVDDTLFLEVLMDDDGFITGTKVVDNLDELKQSDELAMGHFLAHYGVRGMRWGVRKANEENKGMLDPEGHNMATDIFKAVVWPMVPPLGLFAIPAEVRLVRGAARGAGAKKTDMDEKRFSARAQSEKNFVAIHNKSADRFNREIEGINKKYPNDLTKNPTAQKRYDAEVQKLMQDSYREAANSIGNRSKTMHLDVEFKRNGEDFHITAKEGPAKSLPLSLPKDVSPTTKRVINDHNNLSDSDFKRKYAVSKSTYAKRVEKYGDPYMKSPLAKAGKKVPFNEKLDPGLKHAGVDDVGGPETAVDEELEFEVTLPFTGKIQRDTMGHILGLKFDGIEQKAPVAHSISSEELGAAFIEHYGVKGMRWGVRKPPPAPVGAVAVSHVPHGAKRKTKIEVEGGENHDASEDAIRVAQAKAKLVKSGTHALSNKELQDVANRAELEARVKRATQGSGQKFVTNLLRNERDQAVRSVVRSGVKTGARATRKAAIGF